MKTQRVTLAIVGLSCGGGGALTVERAMERLPGVRRVYVNPATEMAYVEFDPERVGLQELAAAVDRIGFHAEDVVSL